MKKCIGIISYLPQKWSHRVERFTKLISLLDSVNRLFNLPVIIIAQNYKEEEINKLNTYYNNITLLEYQKLGITGARETLRQEFLKTDYEVIILLDDDAVLKGGSATEYLKQIDDHPGKLYERSKSLHKLMAVHRDAYKLQAYDLENTPEEHIAYEDRLYFWTLVTLHPELHYKIPDKVGPWDISVANYDKFSSWSKELTNSDIKKMSNKTDELISQRTGVDIKEVYKRLGYVY